MNDLIKISKPIALIHGVFDGLHLGHIKLFHESKRLFPEFHLMVSVTSDQYVNKGTGRPVFSLENRITVLRNISTIDFVVSSPSKTAVPNIVYYKPIVYIKGRDHLLSYSFKSNENLLLEEKNLKKYGGHLIFIDCGSIHSIDIYDRYFNTRKNSNL